VVFPAEVPSYCAVLRTPFARRTFLLSLVGRLSYGTVFLALVLAVSSSTGSYAQAGAAVAVFGLVNAVVAPGRAGLVDRYGPGRVLPGLVVGYAALLAALAVVTWQRGPGIGVLVPLCAGAGACAPPLGPVMRAAWSELLADAGLLQRAYSLDTVCEEILYVVGPLIVGALVVVAAPAVGVAVSAGLVLVGTLGFVRTPPVRARRGVPPGDRPHSRKMCGPRGLPREPLCVAGGLGVALGALNLFVVVFVRRHGQVSTVAWIEAALAVGSAVGGLAYGSRSWRVPIHTRLALLAGALAVLLACAGASPAVPVLALAVTAAGVLVAPTLTTAYLLADETATEENRTRAGTWVNTAFNLGDAAGAAGAGLVVGGLPIPACFALAAGPLLLSALVPGARRTAAPPEPGVGGEAPDTLPPRPAGP
jgi:hypothetical protein